MEWFRCYTRTLDSAKVQGLSLELFKAWFNLCCLARVHDGPLPTFKEIAFRLRVTEQKAQHLVTALETANLIDRAEDGTFYMHDWNEHQRVSDDVAQRVAKHREKRKGNVTVTPSEQSRTDAEQNRAETAADAAEEFQLSPDPPSPVRSVVPAGPTFEDWWKVWWNKTAKADAEKAWKQAQHHGAQFLIDQCVADRKRFEGTESWEWRLRLHPATWLRGKRWEDQLPPERAPITQNGTTPYRKDDWHG
jgi:hypothetical protein